MAERLNIEMNRAQPELHLNPRSETQRQIFSPVDVHIRMELLQQEAVQLPLALCLLVLQQRAILTGPPTYSEHSPET